MREIFEYELENKISNIKKINSFEEYNQIYKNVVNSFYIGEDNVYNDIVIKKTSFEYPLTYEEENFFELSKTLYVNEEYFNKYKEEILSLIIKTIEETKSEGIKIGNKELITDEVIDAIKENENIKKVSLGYSDDYTLTENTINKLLANPSIEKIEADKIEDKLLLAYNKKIKVNNQSNMFNTHLCLESIVDEKNKFITFYIENELTEENLKNIKELLLLGKDKTIKLRFENKTNFYQIIESLKENNLEINLEDAFTYEEYKFLAKYDNIKFVYANEKHSTKTILKKEEILNLIINEVKSKNLSPLEQYMYLYNITKMYKEYKEAPEDRKTEARTNEYTLFNEYMVCVGYAHLLETLVKKLDNPNIKTKTYSTTVNNNGHQRCLTKITDESYGIDGIYISDPTWDHVMYRNNDGKNISHVDLYNHMLMTKEEVNSDYNTYNVDITDIIFSKEKANEIIEEISIEHKYKVDKAHNILEKILDKKMNKEEFISECKNIKQQEIKGEVIIEAITNMYQMIYKDSPQDKIDEMIEKNIHNNNISQQRAFTENQDKFKK